MLLVFAYFSDKLERRSLFIFAGQCMALVGLIINITNAPRGVQYFGMFLCSAGSYSGFPGVVAWLGNDASSYKRGWFSYQTRLRCLLTLFMSNFKCFIGVGSEFSFVLQPETTLIFDVFDNQWPFILE